MNQQIGGVKNSAAVILKILGGSALIVGSLAVPNLAAAVAPLIKKQSGLSNEEAAEGIRYLTRRGWVDYKDSGDSIELYLTKQGKARWQKIELNTPLASKRWDRKWRIVIFDIPNRRNLSRDALRNHLKRVGFRQLQESVWVTPHDCGDLITALRAIYSLKSAEVRLITAASFEGEAMFEKSFGIAIN